MNDSRAPSPALLPAGLRDLLPPQAEAEAISVDRLLETFARHGYERVQPPMLEFADTLLAGGGHSVADQSFRVMDAESHRMMALRADITPQIARIATTRLAAAPRPLRLAYTGQCLRVSGHPMAPDRQIGQVGIELIGVDRPEADAELVAVGAEALATIGVPGISFDLTMPPLLGVLLEGAGLAAGAQARIAAALDRKDAATVRAEAGALAGTLEDLLLACGRSGRALRALRAARLPPAARRLTDLLEETVAAIVRLAPDLMLTVDPVEQRGFRYHTGICMTVFAVGRRGELGRGGRYLADGEAASGLTFYADAVLRAAPVPAARRRVLLAADADPAAAAGLRAAGTATLRVLEGAPDPGQEARRLQCEAYLAGSVLHSVTEV